MKSTIFFIISLALLLATAQSCLECGEECRRVCGTKQFKACCFNYLKKRSFSPSGPDLKTLDGNSQLEVSLANSAIRRNHDDNAVPMIEDNSSDGAQYIPWMAILARHARLTPSEQNRLQLIYDA